MFYFQKKADVNFAPKRKRGDFYIFQFSHNSSPFTVKKQYLGPIRAKAKKKQFEIELLMNTKSDAFDRDRSKEIASILGDDKKEDQEKYFPNRLMDKQLLNSEKLTSTGFQFALGYLRDDLNEVKLIPIKSLVEFKPAFRYFDKAKIKTSNKKQDDEEEDEEDEFVPSSNKTVEPATAKKVTMRFEDKKRFNDKNLNNNQLDEEEEDWVDVQFFDYGLPKFEREKNIVLYKVNEEAGVTEDDRYVY